MMLAVRFKAFFFRFTLALGVALAASGAAQAQTMIHGVVYARTLEDRRTGVVPHATVVINGRAFTAAVRADAKGQYAIFGMPPGMYVLSAQADGYALDPQLGVHELCVHGDQHYRVDLALLPPGNYHWDNLHVQRRAQLYALNPEETADVYSMGPC